MSDVLFKLSNVQNDPEWIIKEFFNSAYSQGEFISTVSAISKGRSCIINEDYCIFPEPESSDPEMQFDGVKFGIMDDQVLVTQDAFRTYLRTACGRFIQLHPEERDKLPIG
jgi:hypothetical protein